MNVFIINLKRSTERLAFQQQQFDKLGLSFDRIDAVSTAEISEQQYQTLAFGWQRPLRPVELACFLSHQAAWQKVLDTNQPALILEDDAVLSHQLPKLLAELEQKNLQDVDLINFEVRSRKKIMAQTAFMSLASGHTALYALYQDRTGAAGYLLYPSGAKKLLDRLKQSAPAIADGFIFSCYELNAFQAEPAAIIQEDQMAAYGLVPAAAFESVIGRSEHHQPVYRSASEKRVFKRRRLVGQWTMACRYLQVLFKAQKRFIRLDPTDFK